MWLASIVWRRRPRASTAARKRAEMIVELALGDRVEQRALRLARRARRHRPVALAAASRTTGHRRDGRRAPGRTVVIAAGDRA
jgi:hypothetical protein